MTDYTTDNYESGAEYADSEFGGGDTGSFVATCDVVLSLCFLILGRFKTVVCYGCCWCCCVTVYVFRIVV
jgi:hypothetical protein